MNPDGLLIALQFLTRLPVGGRPAGPHDLAAAAPWFPGVGTLIGAAVAAGLWLGSYAGPWVGALLALVVWIAITGALHLDGLGDVADALGAAHESRERFVAVVHDPHVGSFAVVAIALQIVAKVVLLATLAPALPLLAIILVAAWARWVPLVLARAVPPLSDGLGARFAEGGGPEVPLAWAGVLALASIVVAAALLVALLVAPALALYWRRHLGGITGDCHGASIEVTETLLLAALAFAI